MKNQRLALRLIITAVLGLGLFYAVSTSCQPGGTVTVHRTIYKTRPLVATTPLYQNVQYTIVMTQGMTVTLQGGWKTVTIWPTAYTPIYERPAPEIPHPYILDLAHSGMDLYDDGVPVCFVCHPMPWEHEKWIVDAEICQECHKLSPNPSITPK